MFGKIKYVVAAVVAIAGVGIAAPAAFACSGTCSNGNTPVSATATVGESITLSGLSPTIPFGTLIAGASNPANDAEKESVSTNDASGFTLSIIPGAAAMANGAATIPNSDLAVFYNTVGSNANNGMVDPFSGSSTLLTDTETKAGTYNYDENWYLNAPAVLPAAGTYSETFTYLALAS